MISMINRVAPILFGAGASYRTGVLAKELGVTRVLCIYDQGIKDAGIADHIVDSLRASGIKVSTFNEVEPDPSDHCVHAAAEIANKEGVDGIVGVGGGSVMDTAKMANILTTNPPPINLYTNTSLLFQPGKTLILIPTTSGTGSEVTNIAVLTDTLTHKKSGILGPNVTATQAIVDPELTLKMPPSLTAATGMDAMAHAVEALTSTGMNPMSDVLAEKAISLITENLPSAVQEGGNLEARTNMIFASTLAGIAFSDTVTHIGHAIAHAFGHLYQVPHGVGCAQALPPVIEFIAVAAPEKVHQIGKAMGLTLADDLASEELGKAVADAIREFNQKVGIPGLDKYNVNKGELPQLAAQVMGDLSAIFSPRLASVTQVFEMLDKACD